MTMTELEALRCVLNTAEQQAEEAHDNNEDEAAMLSEACGIVQSLIHRAEQGSATEYGVEDMVRQGAAQGGRLHLADARCPERGRRHPAGRHRGGVTP